MKAQCGTCGRKTTKNFAKEYWHVIQSFYRFFFLNWTREQWLCNGCVKKVRRGIMKIKELIEKLNEFDPNCEVVVQSESYYDCSYLARAEFVTATEIHEGTLAKPSRVPAIAITQTKEEIR